MKKSSLKPLILLILTLITLIGTVFAWVTVTNKNNVEPFTLNVTDYSMEISLTINDLPANTKEAVDLIFFNAKPNDSFKFNLKVKFTGNVSNYQTQILLFNISNSPLLEAFYIKNGSIIKTIENDNYVEILDEENYYFIDLIDEERNITLTTHTFNNNDEIELEFTLVFDKESQIQEQKLIINSIRIKGV